MRGVDLHGGVESRRKADVTMRFERRCTRCRREPLEAEISLRQRRVRGYRDFAAAARADDVVQCNRADGFELYTGTLCCAPRRGFWQREWKRQVDAAVRDGNLGVRDAPRPEWPEPGRNLKVRQHEANRFARTDVVQCETGPWKDAGAGRTDPDRLAKPTGRLALERSADTVAA